MSIKLTKIKEERKKNKLIFMMKDTDEAFANTIRRMVVEEVPTLAVEDVEIKENNTALYDEMLALRLGLLPLKTDLKSYNLKSECKCGGEGCAQCELKITLKGSKKGYLKAGDTQSTDPKCTFVYDDMIIVKLLPKQKVDVTMTAILGKGKEHAKWSAGWAYYKKEASVKLGKVNNAEKVAKACVDGVFSLKGNKLSVNADKVNESRLLEFYADLDKGIEIEYTDNIIFTLESWGQLSIKQILDESANILIQKCEELEKAL
jgi:DNA-directed RNA polymerase subunit D